MVLRYDVERAFASGMTIGQVMERFQVSYQYARDLMHKGVSQTDHKTKED